jgi:hypothetical protein
MVFTGLSVSVLGIHSLGACLELFHGLRTVALLAVVVNVSPAHQFMSTKREEKQREEERFGGWLGGDRDRRGGKKTIISNEILCYAHHHPPQALNMAG